MIHETFQEKLHPSNRLFYTRKLLRTINRITSSFFAEFAITCVISLVASIFLSVMKVGLLAMAFELILENHLQASTSISIH